MALWEYLWAWSWTTQWLYHLNWNATDDSWNWNNLTPNNISWVWGKIWSWSASFNWSSSYLTHPTLLDNWLSSWTISFWFKTTWTSGARLISKEWPSGNPYIFIISINTYARPWQVILSNSWGIFGANVVESTCTNCNDWERHNVVCTWNSSGRDSLKIYIDWEEGYNLLGDTWWDTWSILADTTKDIFIWKRYNNSNYLDWEIDEIIIEEWNWTAEEVKKYYTYQKGLFWIL